MVKPNYLMWRMKDVHTFIKWHLICLCLLRTSILRNYLQLLPRRYHSKLLFEPLGRLGFIIEEPFVFPF